MIGHACWVTRWLQPGDGPALRTAYIEVVAVEPELRRRSVGSAVMERVRQEIQSYELSGLWPDHPEFYAWLGWDMWRGPLAIRTDDEVQDTPDDKVMVLRTPFTPEIDFDARLTAEWRPREVW